MAKQKREVSSSNNRREKSFKKRFTIEEADKELALIKKELEIIMDLQHEIELYEEEIFNTEQFLRKRSIENQESKCSLKEELYQRVKRIEDKGCKIKDIKQGIIHFPINFQQQEAVLCYHVKDNKIKYWHLKEKACDERERIIELDQI